MRAGMKRIALPPHGEFDIRFNADGLVPVIAQNTAGAVLMLAYMDEEAIKRTVETQRVTYWSRSRRCYWVKGETSGHTQTLLGLTVDCDGDTLLAVVEQVGPACHTGRPTCFFTDIVTPSAARRS